MWNTINVHIKNRADLQWIFFFNIPPGLFFWVGVLCTVFCVGLCVCMMCLHKVIELIFLFVRLYSEYSVLYTVYASIAGPIIIGSKKSREKIAFVFWCALHSLLHFCINSLSFLSVFLSAKSNTIITQKKKFGINNYNAKYIIYMLLCVNV